jgi:hypothetical protein
VRASSALGIGGAAIFCSFNPALRTGLIRVHSGQESRTAPDSELEERVYSYVPGEPKVRHLSTLATLEGEIGKITGNADFQALSLEISTLLSREPKREIYELL